MAVVLTVCGITSGVVAVAAILGWVTERGRRVRRRFGRLLNRRTPPWTHIHLEPRSEFCIWSQAPAPKNAPGRWVTFHFNGVVTNLTPGIDVSILEVDLAGIDGTKEGQAINTYDPSVGFVQVRALLAPNVPTDVTLIVVLSRSALSSGPHRGRLIVRDHFGNRHRSGKILFRDANVARLQEARPEKGRASSDG